MVQGQVGPAALNAAHIQQVNSGNQITTVQVLTHGPQRNEAQAATAADPAAGAPSQPAHWLVCSTVRRNAQGQHAAQVGVNGAGPSANFGTQAVEACQTDLTTSVPGRVSGIFQGS